MMSNESIYTFLLLAFGFIYANAQPVSAVTYETMIEVAEESADKGDYANAIEWFEKAYKESKDKDLKVVVGDLYMLLRDYKKAARAYDRVLRREMVLVKAGEEMCRSRTQAKRQPSFLIATS